MAWVDLESELREMFSDVRLERRALDGLRSFRPEKKEDVVDRVRRWRALNRERRNATARANGRTEEAREYQRRYREANRERLRSLQKAWREANKDKIAAKRAEKRRR